MTNQPVTDVHNRRQQRFRSRYGPWALVTGASDGIGKALAAQVAAQGVNVVLSARRRDQLETIACDLAAAHGVKTLVIAADLTQPGGVDQLEQQTRHLDIGLIILSAGFATSGPFADAALARELEMVCLNVTVVARLAHRFARQMVNDGRGGIMLVGSLLGRQGVPGVSSYAATKAYVHILAEGLHHELKPQGIDVLLVQPGLVHTGFAARAGLKYGSAAAPELVARAAAAALGKRASVVPGVRAQFHATSLGLLPRRLRIRFAGDWFHRMHAAATPAAVKPDDSRTRVAVTDGN